MQLKNKVALVTGAGSGIGKEIATLFSQEGATVILTGRELEPLKKLEQELKSKKGNAESIAMDVTNREQVQKTIQDIVKRYKKIDILVNNAGIAKWGSILECSYEDFDSHMHINAFGYFNTIKEIAPVMVGQKNGCIINIITSTVKNTKAIRVVYAASKYAQAGISNAVHEDLKDLGINVTAIYPGKTDTPIHDIPKDDPARKKMLDPREVAKVCLQIATLPIDVRQKEAVIEVPS